MNLHQKKCSVGITVASQRKELQGSDHTNFFRGPQLNTQSHQNEMMPEDPMTAGGSSTLFPAAMPAHKHNSLIGHNNNDEDEIKNLQNGCVFKHLAFTGTSHRAYFARAETSPTFRQCQNSKHLRSWATAQAVAGIDRDVVICKWLQVCQVIVALTQGGSDERFAEAPSFNSGFISRQPRVEVHKWNSWEAKFEGS